MVASLARQHGQRRRSASCRLALAVALVLGLASCALEGLVAFAGTLAGVRRGASEAFRSRGRVGVIARAADLSSLTVPKLKDKLREAGLPVSGKKADLIARLEAAAAEEDEEDEVEEEPEEEEAGGDLYSLTNAQLKDMLRERGLTVGGKKDDLIARLEAAMGEDEEEEEEYEEAEEAPAPKPKKAPKPGAAAFEVGESVEAYFEDDDAWYGAKVTEAKGKGTFVVDWDEDGDEPFEAGPGYIRKTLAEVDRDGPFIAGELVEAVSDDDGEWYKGIIQTDNGDGTFTLVWDEDGEEATVKPEAMKKVVPLLELDELKIGQKLTGKVRSVREFGAFVECGCVRDGLVHISQMPRVERDPGLPEFSEGDRVDALFKDEMEWYPGTIKSANDDGTFTIEWDEDDEDAEEYRAEAGDIKLQSPRATVEVGDVIDTWVTRVTDDGKLGLTMIEGNAGRRPRQQPDFDAFADISPDEWIDGKIVSIQSYGFFVEVTAPSGKTAQGLVHVSRMRDGFVENPEDEGEVGQEVKVRVESVDVEARRMSLSMKEY